MISSIYIHCILVEEITPELVSGEARENVERFIYWYN